MTFPLLQITDARHCATTLKPGELKRLPVDETKTPVTYYVGCPACGSLNVVPVAGKRSVIEDEGLVSMSPGFVCWGDTCMRRVEIAARSFWVSDAAA